MLDNILKITSVYIPTLNFTYECILLVRLMHVHVLVQMHGVS